MDILVSAWGSEIPTWRADISGQWSFSSRSTLTDLDVLPPTCFCEVEISPPEAESSTSTAKSAKIGQYFSLKHLMHYLRLTPKRKSVKTYFQ